MLWDASAVCNDVERLQESIKRVNRAPLGCGSPSDRSFNTDRGMMAEKLGFGGLFWNSIAGASDRDFVFEALQWSCTLMRHIFRRAGDLIICLTAEFGFIHLADGYFAGSSLLPRRRTLKVLGKDK